MRSRLPWVTQTTQRIRRVISREPVTFTRTIRHVSRGHACDTKWDGEIKKKEEEKKKKCANQRRFSLRVHTRHMYIRKDTAIHPSINFATLRAAYGMKYRQGLMRASLNMGVDSTCVIDVLICSVACTGATFRWSLADRNKLRSRKHKLCLLEHARASEWIYLNRTGSTGVFLFFFLFFFFSSESCQPRNVVKRRRIARGWSSLNDNSSFLCNVAVRLLRIGRTVGIE